MKGPGISAKDRVCAEVGRGGLAWGFLLVLLSLSLYFPSPGSFWLGDDPSLLKQVVLHHPWEYFFVPEVWRLSSASNFTPWVLLSLGLDWKLFGLWPMGFYLHQLFSICLLSVTAYIVLRELFSPFICFMGVSLFLLSPPFAESARLLMERHYLEGLLLSLFSYYFYRESVRKDSAVGGWRGSFFYLLAAAAKEIYVPLLFLLPFLVDGPWRRRARCLMPWIVTFLLYVVWRRYMLGRFTGGYGLEFMWPRDLLLLPSRIIKAMGGNGEEIGWWPWVITCSFLTSIGVISMTRRRKLYPVSVGAVLIIAPVLPVSPIMSPRYVWLLLFGMLLVQMSAWEEMKLKGGRLSSYAILFWYGLLAFSFLYMTSHSPLRDDAVRGQTMEGRFVLEKGVSADLLINPAGSGWYYTDLSWLRQNVLHLPAGPSVISDGGILCFERKKPAMRRGAFDNLFGEIWQFDYQKKGLVHEKIEKYEDERCGKDVMNAIHANSPLSLRMTYGNSTAAWLFGPYRAGQYTLFLGRTSESLFPLPYQGKRFVSFKGQTVYFRLRYVSRDGWSTYSPLLELNVGSDDRGDLRWERR